MFDHPIHSILVHFPAGIIPVSVTFFILFLYFKRIAFELFSIMLLNIALIFTLLTLISGIYDWQIRYQGAFILIILIKLFISIILFLVGILIYVLRKQRVKQNGVLSITKYYPYIFLYLILLPCVLLAGYFGGELVHQSSVKYSEIRINYGSHLFKTNCNSCHPYGQNLQSPLIFPADSLGNYGTANLINSVLLKNSILFTNYVRNPKKMPIITESTLNNDDLKIIFDYINYLKSDFNISASEVASQKNINDIKKGNEVFTQMCEMCHPNGNNSIKGREMYKIKGSKVISTELDDFKSFLFDSKFRIQDSKMPEFSSEELPDSLIVSLRQFLLAF